MKTNFTRFTLFAKAFLAISLFFSLAACNKETETLETAKLEELYPLQKGKFITYRLDSLIFFNGGKSQKTNKYQVRHVVDSFTVDNLNRPSWNIRTFLNDSTASGPWIPNGTYQITFVNKTVEVIENNLRVVKLYQPVKEGFTWRGNSYLPERPYAAYGTSLSISLWDFTYTTIDATEKIGTETVPNVTTVVHIDELKGIPITDNTKYASAERSIEKYAKNIGLVYREHAVWENQPNEVSSGTPPAITYNPKLVGFAVKMWMVARN